MDKVNESGTWITTHEFTDEDGAAAVPDSVSYRIDDVGSGASVRGDTDVTPAESVEIEWDASDTSILDETQPYEIRRMTISWAYGTGKSDNAEYFLRIKNLAGINSAEATT